ncbi:DUF6141 family protein [Evansella cellulosilytica]|uniref:Bacterial Pleckstrin homology domain-containing protein n=1 Tax=Evansella cellulosilytica (strain ATCC 21833 / DSM 2522 / FERM P-1141 / JCM 9156 / N-4) TaxID=649639 RepID=E6TVM9_EVAC2|nr:DUF6141 family protein [Evansella cellulosilytica]ADU32157.1 hypothetical protein Bcell_3922 [Evansella cellulosilytica DSM 2522]
MRDRNSVLHREVQRPRQLLSWALVIGIALFFWYVFIQQIVFGVPVGSKPAPDMILMIFWFVSGVVFPVMMLAFIKLIVEVREDGIYIRYLPFHLHYRKFLFEDITRYEPTVFRFSQIGRWGVSMNIDGDTEYLLNRKQGIKLYLKNTNVVIETENPDAIVEAIEKFKERERT